jgi:hypothetical protein
MLVEGEESEEGDDDAVDDGEEFVEVGGEGCGPGVGEEAKEPGVDQGGQDQRELWWEE